MQKTLGNINIIKNNVNSINFFVFIIVIRQINNTIKPKVNTSYFKELLTLY